MWYLEELYVRFEHELNIVGTYYSDAVRWMERNLLLDGEPFRLLPWQREMLSSPADRKIVVHGRRAGATVAMVAEAIYRAYVEDQRVVIATISQQAATVICRYIANMDPGLTSSSYATPNRYRYGSGEIIVLAAFRGNAHGMNPDFLCIDNASFISDEMMNVLLTISMNRSEVLINTNMPCSDYIHELHQRWSQSDFYRYFMAPTMEMVDLDELREVYAEAIQRTEEMEIIPTGDAWVITTSTTDGEYTPTASNATFTLDQVSEYMTTDIVDGES